MAFNIALSGIQAASSDLNIIGNNIANSTSTGFKESRAEFADVYASLLGASDTTTGSGVRLQKISQQFSQGSITFTGNSLDLAVSGSGFFQLDANGERAYTRAGKFSVDKDGFVVNNEGFGLMAREANSNGAITGAIVPLQFDTNFVDPAATTSLTADVTLTHVKQKQIAPGQ